MAKTKRHSDAIFIQRGASNPSGVARSLVAAIDEARAENKDPAQDPAVRLIVHQLAHLCLLDALDSHGNWLAAIEECERLGGVTLVS
jgi:hypothetical protein